MVKNLLIILGFWYYLVVPRVLFDGWSSDDFYALFTSGTEPKELTKTLVTSLKVENI